MKIEGLTVRNYKAIHSAQLDELGGLVVVAGQNGSGKSCLFDAIRLLKSVYGGYQENEFQQWFGEMNINFQDPASLLSIFNNKREELVLQMIISLHDEERDFIRNNAAQLVAFGQQAARLPGPIKPQQNFYFEEREKSGQERKRASLATQALKEELAAPTITAELIIQPGSIPVRKYKPSKTLEVLFSNFLPHDLGIIDFHGPHRIYQRERINQINVDLQSLEQRRRSSLLYNFNQKYLNVKNEMAAVRLRELLSEAAGAQTANHGDLIKALQDLFITFFPGKRFLGPEPMPDGTLAFPVRVGDKMVHDLDELSAGEKEILYGYVRLRNSAPRNSVILIDEPELHLNPRLTRKLPDFYYRNLANNLNNQVWLLTHSDALLRDVLGRKDYSVYHMVFDTSGNAENSALPIKIDEDLDRAVIDLVGDLAAYDPNAKIVIFEGDTESEFDVRMTSELFPELTSQFTCISGTNKARVRGLYALLSDLHAKKSLKTKVFAITDKDSDISPSQGAREYTWDRYHIENYLLEPGYIASAINDALGPGSKIKPEQVEKDLKKCAALTISSLLHSIGHEINRKLVAAINTKIDPKSANIPDDLTTVLVASSARVDALVKKFSVKAIQKSVREKSRSFQNDVTTGTWRKNFRGRDILKQYVNLRGAGQINYGTLRNLILAKMRDGQYKPPGMKAVLDRIVKS